MNCASGWKSNDDTNADLCAAGIEVIENPGAELGRERGGSLCMSCPTVRDPIQPAASCNPTPHLKI